MNTLSKKGGTLALVLILGLMGFFAYTTFGSKVFADDNSALTATPASLIDPTSAAMLAKIESIQLDTTLFTKPAFQSLQDYTVPLPSEATGKSNPFAPLGR